MTTPSGVYSHRPFGHSVLIAEGNLELGNVDPRFSGTVDVMRNREQLVGELDLGVESSVYALVPKAGCDFTDVDEPSERIQESQKLRELEVIGDALVTRRHEVGLMLNTADCVPLVTYNKSTNVLALIHLGWKGASERLHAKVLGYAESSYGAKPGETDAYLGPSISAQHYVTDKLSDVQESDPEWRPFVVERDDGFHIDVPGFVIATLVGSGVNARRIIKSSNDTGSPEANYFSFTRHKREGVANGRNGLVVAMPRA